MQIYQVGILGMFGDVVDQKYFISEENAMKEFEARLDEYRQNPLIASDKDAVEHHIADKAITIDRKLRGNRTKEAMIALWSEDEEDGNVYVHFLVVEVLQTED